MNLLEHYIEHIISVVDVTKEWEKCMQEEDHMLWYHKSEWDKIQEQGYYMS